MSNRYITNRRNSIVSFQGLVDVYEEPLVLQPQNNPGDTKEISAFTASSEEVTRALEQFWVDLTLVAPPATQPHELIDIADPHTQEVRYINATTGDDESSGETVGAPWLTLEKGLLWQQRMRGVNRCAILEIAGSFVWPSQLNLGTFDLGAIDDSLDLSALAPSNFFPRSMRQIRARLVLDTAVTPVSAVADPDSGLYTMTVTETLSVNALAGKKLVGGDLGQYGTINSNGVHTIEVAVGPSQGSPFGWTGPVGAYNVGATIASGDGVDGFASALVVNAFCDWSFSGISFTRSGAQPSAVSTMGAARISFMLCDIDGLNTDRGVGEPVSLIACYLYGTCGLDNKAVSIQNSVIDSPVWVFHESGGSMDFIETFVKGHNEPIGGGSNLSSFAYAMVNCDVSGGTAGGLIVTGGRLARVTSTKVHNNTGDGTATARRGYLILNAVKGSGNTGYGCSVTKTADVEALGGTSVTGSLGNVFLGGAGAKTWGNAPTHDLASGTPQFCRMS
jgi:hypothetical protein